jgi:hypothetical protein
MCFQHGEPGLQSTQFINWCETGSSGGIGGQSGLFASYIRERGSIRMSNSLGFDPTAFALFSTMQSTSRSACRR